MIMELFSIKDRLVGYGNCFTDVSIEVAKRGFKTSIMSEYNSNPYDTRLEDLVLFHLGSFDTSDGSITLLDTPDKLLASNDLLDCEVKNV